MTGEVKRTAMFFMPKTLKKTVFTDTSRIIHNFVLITCG